MKSEKCVAAMLWQTFSYDYPRAGQKYCYRDSLRTAAWFWWNYILRSAADSKQLSIYASLECINWYSKFLSNRIARF